MTSSPDTKDWTWVVSRPCDQCGFDPQQVALNQVPSQIKQQAQGWERVLGRGDASQRPDPQTWAPVEYGAHIRDMMAIVRERVGLMLDHDNPDLPNWDQDQAALEGRYEKLSPVLLIDEIDMEATMLANAFAKVSEDQADRPGRRTDGSEFTIETLGRYLLHDLVHHAWDVRS